MKKLKYFYLILFALVSLLAFSRHINTTVTANEGHCASDSETVTKDESSPYTQTAPNGKIFTKIYVKAGPNCFSSSNNGTLNNGCYLVNGIGTTTSTVSKVGNDGPNCKDISHVEFVYSSSSPTPTPTLIPSSTPTPTITPDDPTPTPTLQPEDPTPTLIPSSTPTPTIIPDDPTSTPTPAPTSTSSSNTTETTTSNNSSQPAVGGISIQIKRGEVLGVSSLASTGSFMDNLGLSGQNIGLLLSGLGTMLYVKKRKLK